MTAKTICGINTVGSITLTLSDINCRNNLIQTKIQKLRYQNNTI